MTDGYQVQRWKDTLAEFKRDVYPKVFAPHGLSYEGAIILWQLNLLYEAVTVEAEEFDEEPDEGGE